MRVGLVRHRGDLGPYGGQVAHDDAAGRGERDCAGDVLGSGALTALLATAEALRLKGTPCANRERADAERTTDLVGCDGDSIRLGGLKGNAAEGLDGVNVDNRAAGMGNLDELRRRLYDARLVVGRHDTHEGAVLPHDALEFTRQNDTAAVGAHKLDFEPAGPQQRCYVKNGVMLDGGEDDPLPLV